MGAGETAAAQAGEKPARAREEAGSPALLPLPGFYSSLPYGALCILAGAASAAPLAGCWICLVPAALLLKNGCMSQGLLVSGLFSPLFRPRDRQVRKSHKVRVEASAVLLSRYTF